MLWIEPLTTRYWCNCSAAERGSADAGSNPGAGFPEDRSLKARLGASLLPFVFLISRRAHDYKALVRSRS